MKSRIAAVALTACLSAGVSAGTAAQTQQMSFICDLGGVPAEMTLVLEYVTSSGVTLGPGVNPDISGVIPTGDYTLYTAGEVRSPNAHYSFRGQGQYADFTNLWAHERFRVKFVTDSNGLWMIVNSHQPPEWQGRHFCQYAG